MGTFGTGPFDSDGAEDMLDELAGQSAERREEALAELFSLVVNNPELLWREYFPDEVVVAAAVVAANLPGGEYLRAELASDREDPYDMTLPCRARALAPAALDALLVVAGPGGPWHQNWQTDADAAKAGQTTDNLIAVLQGS